MSATCPIPVPAGIRYDGPWPFRHETNGETVHLFTDLAETKSTIGIYESQLTEEKLASEVEKTRAKFTAASLPFELFYNPDDCCWYAEISDWETNLIEQTPPRYVTNLAEGKAVRLLVIADAHAAIARLQREAAAAL